MGIFFVKGEEAMIHSYSLHTSEIDDLDIALEELRAQAGALPLLANSVGLLVCHYDFVSSGIVRAAARELPFPIIGFTTFYQQAPAAGGLFELTVTVLTSDDVRFSVAESDSAPEGASPREIVQSTYHQALGLHSEAPSLILSFLSMRKPVSGDEYLRLLDECSGGVPTFGAVSICEEETGINAYVFCGEHISSFGFAVLLLTGDVKAQYYYSDYKSERLLEMTATVTAADDVWVRELNGQPALDFLRKNGFEMDDSECELVSNVPFLYKPQGEERLTARTLCGFDPASGALRFLGEIPENALLRVGTVSIEDLLEESQATIRQAVGESGGAAAMLIFSCMGRYITLGLDPMSEMERIVVAVPQGMAYLACYVGGEICPVAGGSGAANRYHNASFVVCALA